MCEGVGGGDGGIKLALYKAIMGVRQTARLQTKSDAESWKPLDVHSLRTASTAAVLLSDGVVQVGDVTTFYQVVSNNLHFR